METYGNYERHCSMYEIAWKPHEFRSAYPRQISRKTIRLKGFLCVEKLTEELLKKSKIHFFVSKNIMKESFQDLARNTFCHFLSFMKIDARL